MRTSSDPYTPLPYHVAHFLQRKPPSGTRYIPSGERLVVETQLKLRTHFPAEAWAEFGVDSKQVEHLLKRLAVCQDWPNHHFLPTDPLASLCCIEGLNDFGPLEFLIDLGRALNTTIPPDKMRDAIARDATLAEFMTECLHTATATP
jgi:hypothetical protein